ncbi:MAG: exonuclease SbcCD subunit D [Candidatus Caldarchaeum sp.]|nr:exonuclease SbcCD subunit D [Candidatus Caldarchaeum sp.]
MVLVAHLADIHLGYRQYDLVEREEDVYEVFEEAVERIVAEHAKLVLVAGDLFHSSKPPIRALYAAKNGLERLRERGVRVFCVLGDHDTPKRIGEWSPVSLFRDGLLTHVDSRVVELEGNLLLAGLDKPPAVAADRARETLEQLSRKAASTDAKPILLTHLPLRSSAGELSVDTLPKGFSYYALGHEHIRKTFPKHDGIAAYPGSLEIFARDEVVEWRQNGKGFYLVDMSDSTPEIHRINLERVRPQEVFQISLKDSLEKVVGWVSAQRRKKPIIHLTITDPDPDLSKIRAAVDYLRGSGCLEVRYRRMALESDVSVEELAGGVVPTFNLEELIKNSLGAAGLSAEEAELALKLYRAFHVGGAEALQNQVMGDRPDGDR